MRQTNHLQAPHNENYQLSISYKNKSHNKSFFFLKSYKHILREIIFFGTPQEHHVNNSIGPIYFTIGVMIDVHVGIQLNKYIFNCQNNVIFKISIESYYVNGCDDKVLAIEIEGL